MKLHYVPKTRATRPRWMLEELGVPYELVRHDPAKGETRSAEYLRIHPLGHVPALEDGDVSIFESAAICLHLAEKDPQKKLLPPPGTPGRAKAYQWLFFAVTEMEPPLLAAFVEHRKPEGARDAAALAEARERFRKAMAALEPALASGAYLLGADFSVADVLVGSCLSWSGSMGMLDGMPALESYVSRLRERPAWNRAMKD